MPPRTRLFDNGVNTVTFAAAAAAPPAALGRTLAVTFDPFRNLDVERPGFGETVLTRGGVDVLAVQKRRENWYQDISRETFAAEFGARIGDYGRVLFYGSSAGAYAALYFARPFAARVLAISPRASIHPSYPAHESARARWRAAFRHGPMAAGEDRTLDTALLYDPRLTADGLMGADLRYLEQEILGAYPAAARLPLPYSGHPSTSVLADLGLLKPLLFGFLETGRLEGLRPDPGGTGTDETGTGETGTGGRAGAAAAPWRARRGESWNHRMQLGRALLRHRRPAAALALSERALALQPARAELFQLAAQIREAMRDTPGALAAMRRAVALAPAPVAQRLRLAQMLRAQATAEGAPADAPPGSAPGSAPENTPGNNTPEDPLDEAVALLREGLALAPEQPELRSWLLETLRLRCERRLRDGAVAEARADAQAALAMLALAPAAEGGPAETHRHRSNLLMVLDRQEEALEAAAAASGAAPDRARYRIHQTTLLLRAGRLPEARAAAEAVVRLAPAQAASYRLLGEVLDRMALREEAVRAAEGALREEPGNPRFRDYLAAMLVKAGRPAEALAVLDRAIAEQVTHAPLLERQRRLAARLRKADGHRGAA